LALRGNVINRTDSGAPGSDGRTSWTGSAEIDDYTSVAGFFIHYLHLLRLHDSEELDMSISTQINVLFGGYSYGSMIASRLPALPSILTPFGSPQPASPASEILERAELVASQTNDELKALQEARRNIAASGARKSLDHTLAIGESPVNARKSRDLKRSPDIRRSIEVVSRKLHLKKENSSHVQVKQTDGPSTEHIPRSFDFPINIAYLLVSPLLPPVSLFTALPLHWHDGEHHLAKLKTSPVLAVFGGHDVFTASRKLRAWGTELSSSNPCFKWVEIADAGHFWREKGTPQQLISTIREWLNTISAAS
jgi:pimeloyl-ACP methyl ester carboxylesterase